jgi:DNA-binding beta-propeller fold protein YncE
MTRKLFAFALILILFIGCKKNEEVIPLEETVSEDLSSYAEIASIGLGGLGAAEITTFDPVTKRLFAVNNGTVNKIDVIDISNPATPKVITSISMLPYGGYVNSVDVYNGKLAAAIEAVNKQAPGKVVVFDTETLRPIKEIVVGSLPDMVTYSKDGKFILTANEGEPDDSYANDPIGSVSIINVENGYTVSNADFSGFASRLGDLSAKGFRVFGPGLNIAKDVEPEYITTSEDGRVAWVTLQENNAIAEIDIRSATVKWIYPLGFKNYSAAGNNVDMSDRDSRINFASAPVFGTFMPDAIASLRYNGKTYLFTANEGDSREYTGFSEIKRLGLVTLDPTAFPNAAALRADAALGRLNITTTLGDKDKDGDFDEIYSLGGRSFSIWDASTGTLVWDSKDQLDRESFTLGLYDDTRSDDKGAEPESITLGRVGSKTIAIVGLERADAFAIYDITNPLEPVFVKMYKTGDAPEGVLFIPASKSPIQQSLIVVSSENDGFVKIYKANKQ